MPQFVPDKMLNARQHSSMDKMSMYRQAFVAAYQHIKAAFEWPNSWLPSLGCEHQQL
jgi:hypothetical protein